MSLKIWSRLSRAMDWRMRLMSAVWRFSDESSLDDSAVVLAALRDLRDRRLARRLFRRAFKLMDIDDEYGDDEFILDANMAAQLDTLEKSYFPELEPPPPKRLRTVDSLDEDLPEISIDVNGSYAVRASAVSSERPVVPKAVPRPPQPRVPSTSRAIPIPRPQPPRKPIVVPPRPPPAPPPAISAAAQAELEELRRQVAELSREKDGYKAEANAAKEAKWATQGEVANLRRGMEKTTRNHAEQLVKLKRAKDESEAKQIAIQKEMQAEMERLKAQRTFRDMENSSRKVPSSVRAKRIGNIPATPAAPSSQRRGWNPEQTPLRGRAAQDSPCVRFSPDRTKKPPKLLGFQNASKTQVILQNPFQGRSRSNRSRTCLWPKVPPTSNVPTTPATIEEHIIPSGEPFNWKAELTRLVLTLGPRQSSSSIFKHLSALPIPPELSEAYSDATTRVLDAIATVIASIKQFDALALLLRLLSGLSRLLPTFSTALLNATTTKGDDMLELLRLLIHEHLTPTKSLDLPDLAREVLGLMEGLCWDCQDESTQRLSMFCDFKILMVLLDTAQPAWLLSHVIRFLAQMATHAKLAHKLVPDASILPHIERLCLLLIDKSRSDIEGLSTKKSILRFFSVACVAHTDIHTALVGSPSVIPSLVAFCSHLTSPFWEDPECFSFTVERNNDIIHLMGQTLFLLHYLVFGLDAEVNLRQKLHDAPSRPFNGISHIFMVSFGRMSCGDPPHFLNQAQKREVESLSDLAQDLLDLVVDGPELDNIWAALASADTTDAITVDDAVDMEAKLKAGPG
ncbi:hypothetical protein MKEN_00683100 [Mycena kentingensis (nom. inval.)]|nr:hypothetical protein MKEN_00683100 [Mycena kentingensis (nom. inval.)]